MGGCSSKNNTKQPQTTYGSNAIQQPQPQSHQQKKIIKPSDITIPVKRTSQLNRGGGGGNGDAPQSPVRRASGLNRRSPANGAGMSGPPSPRRGLSNGSMLNTNASFTRITPKQAQSLSHKTNFSPEEIACLHETFYRLSATNEDDGVIDEAEFQRAVGSNSYFVRRMFRIMDSSSTGYIDFNEYISGMSLFSERASAVEKAKFCFKMYDQTDSGTLTRAELVEMLSNAFSDRGLTVPKSEITAIVVQTLKEFHGEERSQDDADDGVTFEEFCDIANKRPGMIGNMTITVPIHRLRTRA